MLTPNWSLGKAFILPCLYNLTLLTSLECAQEWFQLDPGVLGHTIKR